MWSSTKLLAAIVGLLAITAAADAADLALPSAAPPAAAWSWSGLYLGLNAGYSGATLDETLSGAATGSGSANIPAAVGGFQLGANYQIGAVVLGIETDFDGSTANKSITAGIASSGAQMPWIEPLRGRKNPLIALNRVDLPLPLAPSRAT